MSRARGAYVAGFHALVRRLGVPGLDGVQPAAVGQPVDVPEGEADRRHLPAFAPLPVEVGPDAPLAALFAPDDPVGTLELSLIDGVRAARAADGGRYREGENPFRIRYAVYNATSAHVVQRLAEAEAEGVDVQVLIEDARFEQPWIRVDDYLRERGWEVAEDHRRLGGEARRTADLVGIRDKGLMHLKARLFEVPGWAAVLSGSMNPNGSAALNEETLHLVREPRVVAAYAEAMEAVLRGREIANAWDEEAGLNVLFTPAVRGTPRAGAQILTWLREEEEQILLMVFSLRDITAPGARGGLVDVLVERARAGVPVVVVTDRKQSDGVDAAGLSEGRDDRTEDRLRRAGIPVYEAINDASRLGELHPFVAMHHKAAVLGRTRLRVITDTANWSFGALGSAQRAARNVESVLFIDSTRLDGGWTGRRYLGQWVRVLERYAAQSVARDAEAPAAEVLARLMAAPGWPREAVVFEAWADGTRPGERVRVTGAAEGLGRWGWSGPGHPLETDAVRWPRWSPAAPVDLPVGARVAWKLTVGDAGRVLRWEAGADRQLQVLPGPLQGPEMPMRVTARWR